MLRNLLRVICEGENRGELTISAIAEIAIAAEIVTAPEQPARMLIGKVMKRRFPQDGVFMFDSDRYTITCSTRMSNTARETRYFKIERTADRPAETGSLPLTGTAAEDEPF